MRRFLVGVVAAVVLPPLGVSASARRVYRSTILSDRSQAEESYDYVIVGGGQSGLTVADRLTEDGNTTVLVIEHGGLSDSAMISTIKTWSQVQKTEMQFFYNITSVPQAYMQNRTNSVLIGKVLGGGSAVNAMMTVRGTREDYDRWGGYFNNSGSSLWSWKGMLPYFKKAINFVPPDAAVSKQFHMKYDASYWGNTSGVYTGWPSYQYPGLAAYLEGWEAMPGIEIVPDSGAGLPGVYWYPTFQSPNKTRSYAKTGHYENARRANYHLLTDSKVTKLLLHGTIVYGVSFVPAEDTSGNATVIRANREVILAAGAIHTPQILQLSGIGPKPLLDSANITTVVDLPGVGQNFQDHPILTSRYMFRKFPYSPTSTDLATNTTFRTWADTVWATNKTGPYTLGAGNLAAWLPFPQISSRANELAAALRAQDPAAHLAPGSHPTVVAGYGAQLRSLATALRGNDTAFLNICVGGDASSGLVLDLHALSRGTVMLDLLDPLGREPRVDYRALSNPLDKLVMADILRYARKYYIDNPTFRNFDPVELAPGPGVQSDEEFGEYLAGTMSPSLFHPSGTAAMMPLELGGVVDRELRVYGIKGLRVVDASVMSTLVGANTCQTVYAVAEMAADLIKGVLTVQRT